MFRSFPAETVARSTTTILCHVRAFIIRLIRGLLFNRRQRHLILTFGVVYTLVFIYCQFNSARDPSSCFFQPDKGFQPKYSIRRIYEALNYSSTFNHNSTDSGISAKSGTETGEQTLCIGIVKVSRPLTQYLDVAVGSLLDGLSPDQRSDVSLQVLFAPTNASEHPSYHQSWVSNMVDRVLTYDQLNVSLPALKRLERRKRFLREKSLIDYRLSLESCYNQTTAPWILMLEDDVVAQKKWYNHTLQGLQTIKDWQQQKTVGDWLYLRLFYTEKFLGWNSENWPIYLFWSLALISIPAFLGICGRRKMRSIQGTLTNPFLALICFVCIPMFIILYFMAGKVTTHPMKPGVHLMNRYGCCSQALLFPREHVPTLASYLRDTQITSAKPDPVDSVVETFANEEHFDRLVISPSQMQHVGGASYKEDRASYQVEGPYAVRGAHGVWNIGFEKAYEE